MERSSLTVIIPVYNKKPWLRRCLDSVVEAMVEGVQVIIIDDGSTDGSGAICDDYKAHGFDVYHTPNGGVSVARNMGIGLARGDYITFLDADDAYSEDALDVMTRMGRHDFNVVQYGQYRHLSKYPSPLVRNWGKGHYDLDSMRRYWPMVWNKVYKRSFIKKHQIRFKKDMQFGEDELFNVRVLIANGELYHAPQSLIHHYFDDRNSLCRGHLTLEKLELLDKAENDLLKRIKKKGDKAGAVWLEGVIRRHRNSLLFKQYGWIRKPTGKYDVVYFLKDTAYNEELRYSLRSIEENWHYNKCWFYGGCPVGLTPDEHVAVEQRQPSKWENVRYMLRQACLNDDITEDFWLFNDDFFVLRPVGEDMEPQYNHDLTWQINRVQRKHPGEANDYVERLKHLRDTLEGAGKPTLNYSVHKPILINRKKMLAVLDKFPDEPMSRGLYANYYEQGGENKTDNKIMLFGFDLARAEQHWRFVSTSDDSFRFGNVGVWLRNKFSEKSRFEDG